MTNKIRVLLHSLGLKAEDCFSSIHYVIFFRQSLKLENSVKFPFPINSGFILPNKFSSGLKTAMVYKIVIWRIFFKVTQPSTGQEALETTSVVMQQKCYILIHNNLVNSVLFWQNEIILIRSKRQLRPHFKYKHVGSN